MSTWRLEVGRAEVAVDEARDVLVEAERRGGCSRGRSGRAPGPSACRRPPGRARRGHRCIFSGRGARGASWSRWASAWRRASARRSASAGSVGRPGAIGRPIRRSGRPRSGAVASPAATLARPDPAGLADERHALPLDGVEAHPERRGLLLGDLADVGGLLVGRHRPAADDALRLADHQPGEVVAVHAPPRRGEQVVRALEPDLERGERRVGLQPVALVDQLAGRRRSARRGSCARPRRPDHRLAVRPRPPRPRPGPAVADRRALEPGDRQDPGDAGRQERLVGRRQVGRRQAALDRPEADARRPSRAATTGSSRAGSRSRATASRAPAGHRRARRTRKMLAVVPSDRWPSIGQEQRVVGARAARLEPGVDVVGARRRLERRPAGWPGRAGRPTRRGAGRARGGRPAAATTGQAWIAMVGVDDLVGRQQAATAERRRARP